MCCRDFHSHNIWLWRVGMRDKPGATSQHVDVYQTKWLMGVYGTVRELTLKSRWKRLRKSLWIYFLHNTNSWMFSALREQTEHHHELFSTKFNNKRFIPTPFIPTDIRSNICSHYVSPSIPPLWLRTWKASWIYILQIYDPSLAAAEIRAEPSELY